MSPPPAGVQKTGASSFVFSAHRAMGSAGWDTQGSYALRRPAGGLGGSSLFYPAAGTGWLLPTLACLPLFPRPGLSYLIKEEVLRLGICKEFFLCGLLLGEPLRCSTLLSRGCEDRQPAHSFCLGDRHNNKENK